MVICCSYVKEKSICVALITFLDIFKEKVALRSDKNDEVETHPSPVCSPNLTPTDFLLEP